MWWCDICEKELKSKETHKFTQKHLENEEKKEVLKHFCVRVAKNLFPLRKEKFIMD